MSTETIAKPAAKPRRVRKAPAAPVVPEMDANVDLSGYLNKAPTTLNYGEAHFFIQHAGLGDLIKNQADLELFAKAVQMTAGPAHRVWQNSEANAKLHNSKKAAKAEDGE